MSGGAPRPFYASAAPAPAPARRLLVITYHFPPDAAVGGLRWQKMSAFAAERGWGVDVICLAPEAVHQRDDTRLAELPPHVRVYGVAERAPWWGHLVLGTFRRVQDARAARAARRAGAAGRGDAGAVTRATYSPPSFTREQALALRDRRQLLRRGFLTRDFLARHLNWARDAAALGRRLVTPAHQVVVGSGPPHLAGQEAARLVARATGLPYVMDMRDPWSLLRRVSEPLATPYYYHTVARYERLAVAQAALVSCNTEPASASMRALYPARADRVLTVMNGSDDDGPVGPPPPPGSRFVMAYAGAIYWDRDPGPLFRAIRRVTAELGLTPAEFGVEFMGHVQQFEGRTLPDIAAAAGIAEFLRLHPSGPRADALALLARARMLVSLPQDSHLAIPSKVFEYARMPAWLLALADPESATAALLAPTPADVVAPHDEERLAAVIRARYLAHAAGEVPAPADAEGRFARRHQAARLLDRIDGVLAERGPAAPR